MLKMTPEEVAASSQPGAGYIQVLVKELNLRPEDFQQFISGIKGNDELKNAFTVGFEDFF